MVLPPAVAGIALLLVFGRRGWLGAPLEAAGISIVFTPCGRRSWRSFLCRGAVLHSLPAAAGFAEIDGELSRRLRSMAPAISTSSAT